MKRSFIRYVNRNGTKKDENMLNKKSINSRIRNASREKMF